MEFRTIRLVAIDDDPCALDLVRALVPESISIETYLSGRDSIEAIRTAPPDIVLLDLHMPDLGGMETLRAIRAIDSQTEVILVTGEYSTDAAVLAIRTGASDYITKPLRPERLLESLDRSIEAIRSHRNTETAEDGLESAFEFHGMVGRSPGMRKLFGLVRRIGPHFRSALVSGATGVGKELVARALHACSKRADRPLIVCNCAAIPQELMESELFGRVRGAYTGAVGESHGYFGRAQNATLLLDEIGELPLISQAALLRAVQFGEVQRLGSSTPVSVDTLIIVCTNRDLRGAVSKGQFREDLLFRLGTFEVPVPALTERMEDIPLLVRHFLQRFSRECGKRIHGLTSAAEELVLKYGWPGNVRELEQALHYAVVMATAPVVDVPHLPAYLRAAQHRPPARPAPVKCTPEAAAVSETLLAFEGDKRQAARALGISRATLYRRLKSARCGPPNAPALAPHDPGAC